MGVNLKAVYDAAKAADEKVNAVLNEMTAAFEEGTEEGKQKALAMRGALDAAKAESQEANSLYVEMRDAAANSDEHARKFVPVSQAAAKVNEPSKRMSSAEWQALSFEERRKFFSNGGQIVEVAAEEAAE